MKHIHKASSAKLVYGVGYGLQLGRNKLKDLKSLIKGNTIKEQNKNYNNHQATLNYFQLN